MKAALKFINWLAALALLACYLAPHISPATFWPIALIGLAYPIILLVNGLFFLFWVIRRKKYLWISLLAILMGWSSFPKLIQPGIFSPPSRTQYADHQLKLLSFNVRLFDLYNWKYDQNKIIRNKIFTLMREQHPDIMTLQEFFMDDTGNFTTLDSITQIQPAQNYHVEYSSSLRGVHHWGIATFSKYSIINRGRVPIQSRGNNICIYSDIKVGQDTLRVYNMHLASIHFQYEEYELLQRLEDLNPMSNSSHSRDSSGPVVTKNRVKKLSDKDVKVSNVIVNLIRRIKSAFILRAKQADAIAAHMNTSPYPLIVCGDFNDTPNSYAYQKIANGLTDAFVHSGKGLGNTFVGPFPYFRIDFILHGSDMISSSFTTLNSVNLSDHYPLTVQLQKK